MGKQRHLSIAAIGRALRQPLFLTTVLLFGGLCSFAAIADAIDEQATQKFDSMVLRSLRVNDSPAQLIGPPWLDKVLRDLTALGGYTVLTMLTFIVTIYLCLAGHRNLGAFTFAAVASGTIVAFALKGFYDRPRPDLVPHILVTVNTASFPSAHAMVSAIVYLTLGAMLTEFSKKWRLKIYVMSVAVALTLLIGATRVFLGVHYPTDVVAGWAAGFAWAYGCRTVVRLGPLWNRLRATRHTNPKH